MQKVYKSARDKIEKRKNLINSDLNAFHAESKLNGTDKSNPKFYRDTIRKKNKEYNSDERKIEKINKKIK